MMNNRDKPIFFIAIVFVISKCYISVESRTVVPFQYGWRFHYGDDPSSPPLSWAVLIRYTGRKISIWSLGSTRTTLGKY